MNASEPRVAWPEGMVSGAPYWAYQDEGTYRLEQKRIFEGAVWNYVCLEVDVAKPGDYRTTFVGEMPVIVVRAEDGEIYAFENRCAHRGALIALDDGGSNARDFCKDKHGPRKLYTATLFGLVFASLSDDVPPIEDYLGEAIYGRIERVLRKPIRVIGRFTQALPNNWKLYAENVKDTYHASLLHLFFGTFRITRLTQGGGVLVSEDGGHHASYTIDAPGDAKSDEYAKQGIRSESKGYRLADPSMLDSVDEFGDRIQLQILTVFPGFVLQQINNALAVRQILPKGTGRMELNWTYFGFEDDTPEMRKRRLKQANLVGPAGFVSMEDGCVGGFVQRGVAAAGDEFSVMQMGGDATQTDTTRATEASVRGFWKAYRAHMGI